ncbi:MAG TPA: fibrobacter succinogenes major paralogous domain-containing protein, partial [Lentimicrobium sp.]|nr:fibrobacter succinogenes major paralogous domain-containing protein [Lentimicrobium sp.]
GPGNTIIDADGNEYNTIWINGQQWMKENLKVTKFRDGTDITLLTDNWGIITPAYCWYNNDQATYGSTYGALYNWYAVQTGKLCPTGWHVPSDGEWYTMENYVDPSIDIAVGWRGIDGGTKLKATTGWSGGGNGSDNYGFSALPGGYRDVNFYNVGYFGKWWVNTEDYDSWAIHRSLAHTLGGVYRGVENKSDGFSVRCVKD